MHDWQSRTKLSRSLTIRFDASGSPDPLALARYDAASVDIPPRTDVAIEAWRVAY